MEINREQKEEHWPEDVSWEMPPKPKRFFDVEETDQMDILLAANNWCRRPFIYLFYLIRQLDIDLNEYENLAKGCRLGFQHELPNYWFLKSFVARWKDRLIRGDLDELKDLDKFVEVFTTVMLKMIQVRDEENRRLEEKAKEKQLLLEKEEENKGPGGILYH